MIEVRGVSGEIRKGYRAVARLRSWHLADQKLSATATDLDDFVIEQGGPYAVVLHIGNKQWVWPSVDVSTFTPAVVARVDGLPQVRE